VSKGNRGNKKNYLGLAVLICLGNGGRPGLADSDGGFSGKLNGFDDVAGVDVDEVLGV
jgi:hypothetical protein